MYLFVFYLIILYYHILLTYCVIYYIFILHTFRKKIIYIQKITFKEINTFTQQGYILLIKSDSKNIFNVTKAIFQINLKQSISNKLFF